MVIDHHEFLKICEGCGEIFDENIEDEACHHGRDEHRPLLPPYNRLQRPESARAAA